MALTFSKRRQRRLPILRLLALAIVALILLLGSNAFAKEKDTGNAKSLSKNDMKGNYTARTLCVDGYKFIVANKSRANGNGVATAISVTQFYEERDGKALPAKCK